MAIVGFDLLGLGHNLWPIKDTIAVHPIGSAIGAFDSTFSNSVIPNLTKLLDSGKFPTIRIHLWWSDAHVIVPLKVVQERAPLYEELAKKYPSVKFYLSHSCEHNEQSLEKVLKRIDLIKILAPSCIPVNCIWKGALAPGVVTEVHGESSKANPNEIVSLDGDDCFSIDSKKWLKRNSKGIISFLWGSRYNLRETGKPAPPPKLRTNVPNKKYLLDVVKLSM